ncbi:MAG: glycosyltransferase family 2 protein [bacterium]|nr:glycosyltransferase family 2 protein [bacterium]
MAKVTISMVTYNAVGYLPYALPTLNALLEEDVRLVILDNASTDESVAYIKKHAPHTTLILSEKNNGFGVGHNEVIRQSESDYVMLFNQDMIIEPDYVRECVVFLENNPAVASVSGILQRAQWNGDGRIKKTEDIDTCGIRIKKSHNVKDERHVVSWSEPFEIFGPSGACAMYRRTALEDIAIDIDGRHEYFDEDFFMYKEDVDIAYRLHWRNWTSYCVPSARAYHFRTKGDALIRTNKKVNYWSYRNHWYMLKKNLSGGVFARCFPFITLYETAKLCYLLVMERATLAGIKDMWKLRKKMTTKRTKIMSRRFVNNHEIMKFLQ